MKTVRLTMAQALVRYLISQKTEIDGETVPLFPGVFAIFGHGNVTCLSEALEAVKDELPTWRGQNEQSMALAAIGFAKAKRRRQIMVALSSIGPGAANMVTAAGTRHGQPAAGPLPRRRRLRQPPSRPGAAAGRAFQQPDHDGERRLPRRDPLLGPHHPSRADHLVAAAGGGDHARPRRLRAGLPRPLPGHAGARLRLPRSVLRAAHPPHPPCRGPTAARSSRAADASEEGEEAAHHRRRRRALLAGRGGAHRVRASGTACRSPRRSPDAASLTHEHPHNVGPIGVIGSASANVLAGDADVVVAIGTRLQDFTTGSWSVFSPDARFVALNAGRFDATKHRALFRGGRRARERRRARRGARRLARRRGAGCGARRGRIRATGTTWSATATRPTNTNVPSYAQVVGAANRVAGATRPRADRRRRLSRRALQELAGEDARHLRLRVRLLLHGLRDRRRLGRQDGRREPRRHRLHRRRLVPDDELRHLFDGADRPQADRRALRQWRLRGHQPPAERQGRAVLQQPDRGLQHRQRGRRRLSPRTPPRWAR